MFNLILYAMEYHHINSIWTTHLKINAPAKVNFLTKIQEIFFLVPCPDLWGNPYPRTWNFAQPRTKDVSRRLPQKVIPLMIFLGTGPGQSRYFDIFFRRGSHAFHRGSVKILAGCENSGVRCRRHVCTAVRLVWSLEGPEPLGPAPAALPVRKLRDFASVNISSSVSIFRGRASMEMKFCIDMAERCD